MRPATASFLSQPVGPWIGRLGVTDVRRPARSRSAGARRAIAGTGRRASPAGAPCGRRRGDWRCRTADHPSRSSAAAPGAFGNVRSSRRCPHVTCQCEHGHPGRSECAYSPASHFVGCATCTTGGSRGNSGSVDRRRGQVPAIPARELRAAACGGGGVHADSSSPSAQNSLQKYAPLEDRHASTRPFEIGNGCRQCAHCGDASVG